MAMRTAMHLGAAGALWGLGQGVLEATGYAAGGGDQAVPMGSRTARQAGIIHGDDSVGGSHLEGQTFCLAIGPMREAIADAGRGCFFDLRDAVVELSQLAAQLQQLEQLAELLQAAQCCAASLAKWPRGSSAK